MPRQHRGPRIAMTIRLSPRLHGRAVRLAKSKKMTFVDMAATALREYIERETGEAVTDETYRANLTVYNDLGEPIERI